MMNGKVDMDKEQIEFLKSEFKVMHLEPGDIVVLRTPLVLSKQAIDNILGPIKAMIPDHHIILLEEGMDIGAIHPTEPT